MDAQLKKLTNLIADLLDVTRVDGGKLQFHNKNFNFQKLVQEIVEEMQLTTSKHTISLKLAPSTTLFGDQDRIGQVITNLLSNAIKYSPHEERIIVTTEQDSRSVTMCVQDFGIGIPPDKQDKVFERFFRAGDVEDTFAGLGLGLFISSEIVKRHNGKIWVESGRKRGSCFCFSLPLEDKKLPKVSQPKKTSL